GASDAGGGAGAGARLPADARPRKNGAETPQESPSEAPVPVAQEIPAEPLPVDDAVPAEVLEFFVPEAEEHLQTVTHCLLSLETNPGTEQIHRLLRAMHTVQQSAAQL